MLTRLGSCALSALGYSSNDDSATDSEMEFDDSKVISGDWVFVREKRPQRKCTKQNTSQTDEWFRVTRKQNKIKPDSKNVNIDYDTMDDLLQSEEGVNTKQKNKSRETTGFVENQNNSVGTVLTRNQRRLMMVAEESKMMLERGTKPKRLQNTSSGRNQNKHQNKVMMQADSNKRGRKRHMMASTYSGKGGRRGC
jgi:hypothetical protein